jgi:hypothetical protein
MASDLCQVDPTNGHGQVELSSNLGPVELSSDVNYDYTVYSTVDPVNAVSCSPSLSPLEDLTREQLTR